MRDRATLVPLARTWQQAFPGTPEQLREVRASIRSFMDGCPAADDLALLVSELSANAIAHSASGAPGGSFTVRVRHAHGSHIDAEITDAGSYWDVDIASSADHPHGLYLLLALAAACGSDSSDRCRRVWFRLDDAAGLELR